jgi:methyltransferase (TIGR00027 family)
MKRGQASATAKLIAASTLLLGSDASTRAQVPPGAAALCRAMLSDTAIDRALSAGAQWRGLRPVWRALEAATLPGMVSHFAQRKAWIEARCRRALAAGTRRVIVLGAGFDTLALRLAPEFDGVQWLEIDHPATQGAKLRGLARHGLPVPAALRFIAADLDSDRAWPERAGGSDDDTLIICEGLLMYLAPERVHSLLQSELRSLARGGLRLVFSVMQRGGFQPGSRLVDTWLHWRGEPFRWTIEPAAIAGWLRQIGYALVEQQCSPLHGHGVRGEHLVDALAV